LKLSETLKTDETDRLAGILERVQKMEAFLERVIDRSAVGLIITNQQGEIVSCNDEIEALFGYSTDELRGKLIDVLIPLELAGSAQRGVLESLNRKTDYPVLVDGARRDGSVFPAQLTVARLNFKSVAESRLCISITDISARKEGEQELMRSRNELQSVIDNAPGLICLKAPDSSYLFVNQNFADFFRLDRKSVRGRNDYDLFPRKIADTFTLLDRAAMSRARPIKEELSSNVDRQLQALIGLRTLLTVRVPLHGVDAAFSGLLTISEDITEEKARQVQLKKNLDEQRLIFDNSPMGILITNEDWIVHANPVAAKLLGWDSPSALVGWETAEMFASAEDYARFKKIAAPMIKAGQRASLEWDLYRRDRGLFSAKLSSQGLPTSTGIDSTVWILEDVSEVKRLERKHQAVSALADAVMQSKAEFLVNMSHEIRTPMNAILGFCELGLQQEQGDKQRSYIAKAREAGLIMLKLVNDILDFSKSEAKKLSLHEEDFELAETLAAMDTVAGSVARTKGLNFSIEITPDVPRLLFGDALRLQQVLINLVSNATKFTETGGIVLRVQSRRRESDSVELEFSVIDTGIGIDVKNREKLFQVFGQADTSIVRKYGGTGLGLSISKALVELMGGSIWLEASEVGHGSDFRFTARFKVCEALKPAPSASEPLGQTRPATASMERLKGVRVLVIEDNEANQEIVSEFLQRQGVVVTCAGSGRTGLERLAADAPYDIVLLDLQMPEMDGFEVVARIRATPALAGQRVVALTAHAMLGERERCLAAGMDDYITKPIHSPSLFRTLLKLLP